MSYSQFAKRLQPSPIRAVSRAIHGKKVLSFAGGMPHPMAFPHEILCEISAEILATRSADALQYNNTQGYGPLLDTLAGYMRGRGIPGVETKNLLVPAGSQQAIDLVGRIFVDPGDLVLMETPGYPGASAIFHNLGARLGGIPVLADGPDLDALEAAVKRERPKFFYTTPNFANPAGVLMSRAKRERIAALAAKYDFWIVEDDAYGELYFSDAAAEDTVPLKAFDEAGRVIYMSTFSKTIAPGLRVASIVAPADVIDLLEMTKQSADMFTGAFTQMLVNEYILRGHYSARLPQLRAIYEGRRNAMESALREHFPTSQWVTPKGGFFFWLEMPAELDTQALLAPALDAGIAFMPGISFLIGEQRANTARLAYSREAEADIAQGLACLGELSRTRAELSIVR
jgi:2-aminoadipate transaminase